MIGEVAFENDCVDTDLSQDFAYRSKHEVGNKTNVADAEIRYECLFMIQRFVGKNKTHLIGCLVM